MKGSKMFYLANNLCESYCNLLLADHKLAYNDHA